MALRALIHTFGGLVVGVGFSLLLGIALLIEGGPIPGSGGSTVSPVALAIAYVVGGATGGFLAGVACQLYSTRWGTALTGILFMFPMVFGIAWAYSGSLPNVQWPIVALATTAPGIPMGFVMRKEYRSFLADLPGQVADSFE